MSASVAHSSVSSRTGNGALSPSYEPVASPSSSRVSLPSQIDGSHRYSGEISPIEAPSPCFGESDTNDARASIGSSTHETSLARHEKEPEGHDGAFPDQNKDGQPDIHNLWSPFYLRRLVLAVFLAVFVVITVALPVLFRFSNRNNGLTTTSSKYQLAWRLAPTAIFALLSAFWGQVEYRSKMLMPWKVMLQGPSLPSNSVFLDYLSPWNVIALFQSVRRSHYMVALPIFGSLLIRLMMIISTGLFLIQEVVVKDTNAPFNVYQTFKGTDFDANRYEIGPFATTYAMLWHNLSHPFGTLQHHAFPEFNVSSESNLPGGPGAIVEVELDVFTFDLSCEPAKVVLPPNNIHGDLLDGYVTTDSGCNFTFNTDIALQDSFQNLNATFGIDKTPCSDTERDLILWGYVATPGPSGQMATGLRIMDLVTLNFTFTAFACSTDYNISRGRVSYSGDPDEGSLVAELTQVPGSQGSLLERSPGEDIKASDIMVSALYSISDSGMSTGSSGEATRAQFFLGPEDTVDRWQDYAVFSQSVRSTISNTAAQVAKQRFLQPSSHNTTGSITTKQYRLVVRKLSFILLEAISGIMLIIIGSIMALYAPCAVCPRDPGSIGGLATIIAGSELFRNTLRGIDALDATHLSRRLSGTYFRTVVSMARSTLGSFQIIQLGRPTEFTDMEHSEKSPSIEDSPLIEENVKWWRPFSISIPARILTIGIPIIFIVALEVLYRQSHSSKGLAQIQSKDDFVRYTWDYLPAVAMVALQALFAVISYAIKVFQPYHALRVGGSPASESIVENHFAKVEIHCLWHSIIRRQTAVAAISLSMILAPFLTIAVSGLYTVEPFSQQRPVVVHQLDGWDIINADGDMYYAMSRLRAVRTQEQLMAGMVSQLNLSYPTWTYDEYSFPQLSDPSTVNDEKLAHYDGSYLEVTVPAMHGVYNCTAVPQDKVLQNFSVSVAKIPSITFNFSSIGRSECGETSNTFTTGKLPAVGEFFSQSDSGFIDETTPDGCPAVSVLFGKITSPEEARATVLQCRPYLEQLQVKTTFLLPNYTIDATRPPKALPNTSKVMFGWNTVHWIGKNNISWPLYSGEIEDSFLNLSYPGSPTDSRVQPDFKALINGRDAIPPDELLGEENTGKLIDGVNHIFAVMMAQMLNSYSHTKNITNVTIPSTLPSFNATVIDQNRMRLVQNVVSTRILQGLLAAMLLCAAIAFLTMHTRRVLTQDPSNIAAVASLLAGSETLNEKVFPPGSEWCSDKELLKQGVFEGWSFNLGWWDEKDGEKRRFGIDAVWDAERRS